MIDREVPHVEPCAQARLAAAQRMSFVDGTCRRLVRRQIERFTQGQLALIDGGEGGHRRADCVTSIHIHDRRFFRRAFVSGSLGAAESYIRGEWSADSLVDSMRILAGNMRALRRIGGHCASLLRPLRSGLNQLRQNTRSGSRRNIAAHYDLSNEFFALMLDPTMTYSAGIFEHPSATMEQASLAKYDRICRKLNLKPGDHVLEIGTGWGGFAIHAARNYGCRVTTTTISGRQHDFARARIQQSGLAERVTLLQTDYRALTGQFDKLVSIEMIEAVGERFLDTYFQKCSGLLKEDGMMVLQTITIPNNRYDSYRRSVDFIQRYIFPGGFLPSISVVCNSLSRCTNFRLSHGEDFGLDYAETLARWRHRFWRNIQDVRQLGFDERFVRMWHYYLCYCEAGFRERQIGVAQLVLAKPGHQDAPLRVEPLPAV